MEKRLVTADVCLEYINANFSKPNRILNIIIEQIKKMADIKKYSVFKIIIFFILVFFTLYYLINNESFLSLVKAQDVKQDEVEIYVDLNGIEREIGSKIPLILAGFYEGENKTICGKVTQISKTRKATFINFGGSYPNHDFSAVIWGEAETLPSINQRICVSGFIEKYRGIPQIKVYTVNGQIFYE